MVMGMAGKALTTTEVTTPKVEPPPLRSAQKRVGLLVSDAVMKRPEGSTTLSERTWSAAMP